VADPELEAMRRDIAAQLKQHERDLAMGNGVVVEPPQPLDPRSMRPKEPGDPGPMAKPRGTFDYMFEGHKAPDKPYLEQVSAGLSDPGGMADRGGPPVADEAGGMAKVAGRGVLREMSGGATEAVANAVAGAGDQAGKEIEGKTLETIPPEVKAELERRAGLSPEQAQAVYAVIKPHWQPGTRTDAQGSTGKDPNAVRAAMDLQTVSERAQSTGLEQTQKADSAQYQDLLAVQKNGMEATKAFKAEQDALQARYDGERQAQMERMGAIQTAMDAVPNAPRTIRAKMDQSGMSDKLGLGLAAAFSVLGGGVLRDGGKSAQTFLGNVQANIDRNVQKEADEFARLGERAKMSDNIYANLRKNLQDDTQAMNITKALYYDAAANAVQQIATQYKMDTQAPQVQSLRAHLAEQRQKLILDTANTMQSQFSQTDKFNPGGVVQVGGGARKDPNEYKSTDLEKDTQEYGKELEKRGFNMGERAIGLYQKAIDIMQKGGFKNDETFKRAYVMLSNPQGSQAVQAAALASLDKPQREALQYIVAANKEPLKHVSGSNVTAHEMTKNVLENGGYSVESLDEARKILATNREQIQNGTAGAYDPRVVDRFHARKDLQGIQRQYAGIATNKRQPIDVKDIATKVEGRLSK
jgi:hypothetical protein